MPLLDIQRQGQQLGRIRLGQQVEYVKNGQTGTKPVKLEYFRFTTNSTAAADQVAALYGGEVREWRGGTERYEIVTTTSELEVMVPPGDRFIRQDYELWTAAGCVRRCDGVTARLFGEGGESESKCVCPADGKDRAIAAAKGDACKPTTRLNVMLPDLPDLGVWRVDSHGFYAAVELGGKAELLERARDAGVILPATLRLEQRERRTPGQQVRRFMVPVLEIGATMRQLATGQMSGELSRSLPPVPAKALTSGATRTPAVADPGPPQGEAAAGPGQSAQDFADLAAIATDVDEVRGLGREARDAGLLADTVTVGGLAGVLGDYLAHRVKALDVVVDAEVVEDGPTADDARQAATAWAGE
jgi:hypothetical protein